MSLQKLLELRKKSQTIKDEKSKKLKYFSLFSGAGGAELGFDDRFELVGLSEIDGDCVNLLDYHHRGIKNYGDIKKIRPESLPDFDILVGGSPCQSFSIAGERKGLDGKSGLFYEFVKILKAKRPKYFIFENVKGLFSSSGGRDFAIVQMELAEAGYDFRWNLVNAKSVGIPQSRERIFIVGTLRDRCSREVFFKERDCKEDFNGRQVEEKSSNESDEKIIGKDFSYCIDSNYYKGANANHKNRRQLVAYSKSTRDYHVDHRVRMDNSANTLSTGEGCRSQSTENLIVDNSLDDFRIRRLTPLECERIMGWPPNFTKYGLVAGRRYLISDSQRYKMCGNGIVDRCIKLMLYNLFGDNNGRL